MIAAIGLLSFLNIGFIGVLQRLMHVLDLDIEGTNDKPWRTELIYTIYFILVASGVLTLAKVAPSHIIQLMWINFLLIMMLSYADALKTRLNIMLAVGIAALLFAVILGVYSLWLCMLLVVAIAALLVERHYFFPFDRYPKTILSGKALLGLVAWLLMQAAQSLAFNDVVAMYIVYLIVTVVSYGYMLLLRREHLVQIRDARNVQFDDLTHARNWLSFRNDLAQYFATNQALGLIAMDVDNFKQINDTYGHLVGNAVLIQMTNHVEEQLAKWMPDARLYRTGGEEFTILLPETQPAETYQLARDVQTTIRQLGVSSVDGGHFSITVSIGVSVKRQTDAGAMTMFKRADHLLYKSKRNGRDQITVDEMI